MRLKLLVAGTLLAPVRPNLLVMGPITSLPHRGQVLPSQSVRILSLWSCLWRRCPVKDSQVKIERPQRALWPLFLVVGMPWRTYGTGAGFFEAGLRCTRHFPRLGSGNLAFTDFMTFFGMMGKINYKGSRRLKQMAA